MAGLVLLALHRRDGGFILFLDGIFAGRVFAQHPPHHGTGQQAALDHFQLLLDLRVIFQLLLVGLLHQQFFHDQLVDQRLAGIRRIDLGLAAQLLGILLEGRLGNRLAVDHRDWIGDGERRLRRGGRGGRGGRGLDGGGRGGGGCLGFFVVGGQRHAGQ